jgi:hypothetical protein
MRRDLFVPDINEFQSFRDFISDFVKSNRERNQKYSHRFWAKRFNWPECYISQLVSGAKNISIRRGLELATFLKMNSFETERLILLIVLEGGEEFEPNTILQKIKVNTFAEVKNDGPLSYFVEALEEFLEPDMPVPPASEIAAAFHQDMQPVTVEQIESALNEIRRLKEIELSDKNAARRETKVHKSSSGNNLDQIEYFQRFYQGLSYYLKVKNRVPRGMTGFARLDEHSLREFRSRIESAFHFASNAISKHAGDEQNHPHGSAAEFYQLQLSVIPIIKRELWPQNPIKRDSSIRYFEHTNLPHQ